MTAKEKNLNKLYKARIAHLKWINTIKLLVSGFKVEQSHVGLPIIQNSEVGIWYYNEALQFTQFNTRKVIEEMEPILEAMFNYYTKIYVIYFPDKQSSIKSFFGKKDKSVNRNEAELASRYYEDIIRFSDEFKSKLHTLERQMTAMQESDHAMISDFSVSELQIQKQRKAFNEDEIIDTENYSLRAR